MNSYHQQQPQSVESPYRTLVEPCVVNRLQSVVGAQLVIETTKDTIRGKLLEVQPDHIALQAGDSTFFVRIQQIVTIMPL
ncbi:YuzF family protein [Halobacillus litoralis]|uniref:YuzF family protein n=1 Tax=Halobacillus litoralis TaxID=45668 RepID=UPI001CFC5D1A|nr:YuzF family protein [Halobacillus litoralis]